MDPLTWPSRYPEFLKDMAAADITYLNVGLHITDGPAHDRVNQTNVLREQMERIRGMMENATALDPRCVAPSREAGVILFFNLYKFI